MISVLYCYDDFLDDLNLDIHSLMNNLLVLRQAGFTS